MSMDHSDFAFCIDTALSWDGKFPPVGRGDYIVSIASPEEEAAVLVSRRYTAAVDSADAAEIALDAFCERRGCVASECKVTNVRKVQKQP